MYLCRRGISRIMSASKLNNEILQSIKGTLQTVIPVDGRVLLFGSQALGEVRADSDWDILILLNKERVGYVEQEGIEIWH